MSSIHFHLVTPTDHASIQQIAEWYLSEWNIPVHKTIEKTKQLSVENLEFQVVMTLNGKPIATGGVYNHVGLLDKEPRLKMYKNWLALVFTSPDHRGKGFGALLCTHIQDYAKALGLNQIVLFTHTAENLYKRLGWEELERLALGGKDIVVMKKEL